MSPQSPEAEGDCEREAPGPEGLALKGLPLSKQNQPRKPTWAELICLLQPAFLPDRRLPEDRGAGVLDEKLF